MNEKFESNKQLLKLFPQIGNPQKAVRRMQFLLSSLQEKLQEIQNKEGQSSPLPGKHSSSKFGPLPGISPDQQRDSARSNQSQKAEKTKPQIQKIVVNKCLEFYKRLFSQRDGKLMFHCPKTIESSRAYKSADLDQILEAALHYGIDLEHQAYLFWLARAAVAMPFPSRAWSKKEDEDTHTIKYYTSQDNTELFFHPADPFLFSYISVVRAHFQRNPELIESPAVTPLYDDLIKQLSNRKIMLQSEAIKNPKRNKSSKKNVGFNSNDFLKPSSAASNKSNNNDPSKMSGFWQLYKKKSMLLDNIHQGDGRDIEDEEDDDLDNLGLDLSIPSDCSDPQQFQKKALQKQQKDMQGHRKMMFSDTQLFEIAKQCKIHLNKQVHLLRIIAQGVEDFKHKEPGWKFRVTIEGFSYWYNDRQETSSDKFPGLKAILHKLQNERNRVSKMVNKFKDKRQKIPKNLIQKIKSLQQMNQVEKQQLGYQKSPKVAGMTGSDVKVLQKKKSLVKRMNTIKKKGGTDSSPKNKNKANKTIDKTIDKANQLDTQNQELYSAVYDQLKNQSLSVTQQYLSMLVKRKGVDQQWDKKIDLRRLSKLFIPQNLPKNQSEKGKKAVAQAYWGAEQDLLSREQAMEMLFACQFNLGIDWNQIKDLINELQKKRQERIRKELQQAERIEAQKQEERRKLQEQIERKLQLDAEQQDGDIDAINFHSDNIPHEISEQDSENGGHLRKVRKRFHSHSKSTTLLSRSYSSVGKELRKTSKLKPSLFNSTGALRNKNKKNRKISRQRSLILDWQLKQRLMTPLNPETTKHANLGHSTILQQDSPSRLINNKLQFKRKFKSEALSERQGDKSFERSFASPLYRKTGMLRMHTVSRALIRKKYGSFEKSSSRKSYPNPLGSRVLSLTTYQFPILPENQNNNQPQKNRITPGRNKKKLLHSKTMKNEKLVLNINLNPDFISIQDSSDDQTDQDNQTDDDKTEDYQQQLQKLIQKDQYNEKELRQIMKIKNYGNSDISGSYQSPLKQSSMKLRDKFMQIDEGRAKPEVLQPGELECDFDFEKRWNDEQNKKKRQLALKKQKRRSSSDENYKEQQDQNQQVPDQQLSQKRKQSLRDILLKKMKTARQVKQGKVFSVQKDGSSNIWDKKKIVFESPRSSIIQIIYFAKQKWARRAREDIIAHQIKGFMKTHSVNLKQISKLLSHLYPKQKVTRLMRAMGISFEEISQLTNTQQKRYNDIHSKIMWLTLINKPLADPKDQMMLRLMKELGHTTNIQKELDVRFTNNIITKSTSMNQILNPKPILDVSRMLGGPLNRHNRFYQSYHPKPRNYVEEEQQFIQEEGDLKRACIRLANVIRQVQTYQKLRLNASTNSSIISQERPFSGGCEQRKIIDSRGFQKVFTTRPVGGRVVVEYSSKRSVQDQISSKVPSPPMHDVVLKKQISPAVTVRSKQSIDLYLPRTRKKKDNCPQLEETQSSMMQTQFSQMYKTDGDNKKVRKFGRLLTPSSDRQNNIKTQISLKRNLKVKELEKKTQVEDKSLPHIKSQVIQQQFEKNTSGQYDIELNHSKSRMQNIKKNSQAIHRREFSLQQSMLKIYQSNHIGTHPLKAHSKTVANLLQSSNSQLHLNNQNYRSRSSMIPLKKSKNSQIDFATSVISSKKPLQKQKSPKRQNIFMRGNISLKQLSEIENKTPTKHYQNALNNLNSRSSNKLTISDLVVPQQQKGNQKKDTSSLSRPHSQYINIQNEQPDVDAITSKLSEQALSNQNAYMQPVFGTSLPTRKGLRSKQGEQFRKQTAYTNMRTSSPDNPIQSENSIKSPIQRGTLQSYNRIQSPILQVILPSLKKQETIQVQSQSLANQRSFKQNQGSSTTHNITTQHINQGRVIYYQQKVEQSLQKSSKLQQPQKTQKSEGQLLAEKLKKLAPIKIKQKNHHQTSQSHLKSALFLSQNVHHLSMFKSTQTNKIFDRNQIIPSVTDSKQGKWQKQSFSIQVPTNTQSAADFPDSYYNSEQMRLSINRSVQSELLQYQKSLYFEHYVKVFGNPSMPISRLKLQRSPLKLNPKQVFVMAMRLGISLTQQMPEYDLIWIAQQAISMPLPVAFLRSQNSIAKSYLKQKNDIQKYDFIASIPPNQHPGDIYFQKLLKFYRKERKVQIKKLKDAIVSGDNFPGALKRSFEPQEREILNQRSQSMVKKDVISQIFEYLQLRSWLEFRQFDSDMYFYNFILKQKRDRYLEKYPPHLNHLKQSQKQSQPVLDTLQSIFPALSSSLSTPRDVFTSTEKYYSYGATQHQNQSTFSNTHKKQFMKSAMSPANNYFSSASRRSSAGSYFKFQNDDMDKQQNIRRSSAPNTNVHILLQSKYQTGGNWNMRR